LRTCGWVRQAQRDGGDRPGQTTAEKARIKDLELGHGDGRFPRLFRSITKAQLLILDDWGPDRLTGTQRRDLMEIVEERYGRGSIMITSPLPITAWHDVIGEPTFADAILDRIVHNAYRLELEGASMRKTIAKMDDEMPQT
jgi:DNA replication protein DnaC